MTNPIRITAEVEGAEAALEMAAMLDELSGAVAAFERREAEGKNPALWRVEAYPREPVLDAVIEIRLALAAAGMGGKLLHIVEERLPERDWLAENRRDFPPQRIGRFFIHGSHWHGRAAPSSIPIEIAAAKRLRRPVVAGDIDPEAVRVARHHARRNGLASRARFLRTAGYRRRALRRHKYDLILANILARPLALMARDLKRTLAPGGIAVLAGLLTRQEPFVLAAHRAQHLSLERRLVIEGWSTLVLRSGS